RLPRAAGRARCLRGRRGPAGVCPPALATHLLKMPFSAHPGNARRLLARDHAAPESTLALAKATSLGRGRVRPLAWCSRPRSSTALPEGSPFFLPLLEHLQHAVRDDEAAHDVRGSQYYGDQPDDTGERGLVVEAGDEHRTDDDDAVDRVRPRHPVGGPPRRQ